jgi:protein-disulfide isomerase
VGAGPAIHKLLENYEGKARLIVKFYPYKYRDFAAIAAQAALAAHKQGKFEDMHDMLLMSSPRLDRDSLMRYAKILKLDMKRFVRDFDSASVKKHIASDGKLALDMDLYSTPAFFFNGRKLLGNRPYEAYEKVMKEELDALK